MTYKEQLLRLRGQNKYYLFTIEMALPVCIFYRQTGCFMHLKTLKNEEQIKRGGVIQNMV